ncbi:FAD/NAD(P)-binding domain-containing protein [Lindgomyces ingoldianus]|uniref:FAD/NAD(P)-binding domain-containing protein n=1 Tax=Lindgomyces ingoldianus TaxID=673940 RepID=A0ACB6QA52_9PLEO|nr:FAD/NAD(P)-binding domain-containing protein [Lindgomyces ingoldianus]KAF2463794.1 FAD/NAD(P)-binding domain-containing protein [Lindgomyces ingoldianus]
MARSVLLSGALLVLHVTAQTASPFTDDKTGITFNGFQHYSGYRFGLALPENPSTDFIGQIVGPVNSTGGWAGVSMASSMTDHLLIVAWPNGDEVVSSFRKATGYTSPPITTGNFSMTTIPTGTYTNGTAFSYTFLCSGCITDDDVGLSILEATTVLGWAWSNQAVTDPTSASSALTYHAAGFGAFGVTVADAESSEYSTWAALATGGNSTFPSGNSTTPIGGGGSANGTMGGNATATISNSTYDYIVAGAGAAGIVAAERLAESGATVSASNPLATVLLLERGGPSFASTGNTDTLSWNSSVTMYDVPGLDYYLSVAGTPAFCTDTADQAGCLLGGGTMVNAMMFIHPQDKDFDDKWPTGWKWSDVSAAADRLYERNPGQNYGSVDGLRYNDQAYEVLSQFLAGNGWNYVDSIKEPNDKKDVFTHPPWSTADGLRAGPVRNYLPLALAMSNFKLMLNTMVIRAVRNGSTISGVETECGVTGKRVIYNVNSGGGVILASGAMSTPRILFNSAIGPREQIQTVASGSTGVILPAESEWINLPVGAEIRDHPIFPVKFSTKVNMPALGTTDFTSPNETTVELFAKGSGALAQSGQRLNFWSSVETSDGHTIFVQGTCNGPANNTISMKIYLTHGVTSVGSLGITADGATEFITKPWLTSGTDIEAATIFMDRLLEMSRKPNSTLSFLSAGSSGSVTGSNVTGADLLKDFTTGAHFVSTAKMGEDETTAVVDTNTKVFGTDNLFVVDASMHPDLPTGNTQAMVMVAAEAAVIKILALKGSSNGSANAVSAPSLPIGTAIPQPSGTGASAATTLSAPPEPPSLPTRSPWDNWPPQPSQKGEAKTKRSTSEERG